jgi:hypothetical protein
LALSSAKTSAYDWSLVCWRMSVVHFFQHPSEGVDGCALVRHSDSMLRVVVYSALCQSSQLLVFEVDSLHSLVGGVPRTVEIDGESAFQDRADGQLMKRPKRSPG